METKVHRVRFYNPKPQPINCASLNKATKQLAIARGDASIEIWDIKFAPYPVKFIPGVENGSVEALGWVHERLLSTGLGGALIEWDLESLALKTTTLLTGYAAWCLDVSPDNTLVAVGTEQGYINLFNVENDNVVYQKLFDKQEGRILCCKFNPTGDVLATGSLDSIRIWNVKTGQATCRLSVKKRDKEVIVWCLAFLSDNTFVSGDSEGRLSFWDSVMGDQIDTYTTHKADITTIAVSEDEQNLYCSGVDPIMVQFVKVQSGDKETRGQWAKHVQKYIHEHDVRVIISHGNQQISAGISGYLVFTSYPPLWIMRIPPIHHVTAPRTSVCTSKKLLLLRYSTRLEIWKLGSYRTDISGNAVTSTSPQKNTTKRKDSKNGDENKIEQDTTDDIYDKELPKYLKNKVTLEVTDKPVKLIAIQTNHKKQIRCCELSPTGEFIFYSTDSHMRMLKLELDNEEDENEEAQQNIFISKLRISGLKSCDRVAFSEDSRVMVAHTPGALQVLQVDSDVGATLVHTINTDKFFSTKSILHLVMSKKTPSGATYLVAADTKCAIAVWALKGKKFEHYVTLPTYQCIPSALSVVAEHEVLHVVYVDQKVIEFELSSKTFLEWPDMVLPRGWFERTSAVQSITKHPRREAVVFQDINSIWVMEKAQRESEVKLPRKIVPVKYLAGFHWLDNDEAVSIEVLPGNIMSQLPALVATKKH